MNELENELENEFRKCHHIYYVLYCDSCIEFTVILHVAFKEKGHNIWYTAKVKEDLSNNSQKNVTTARTQRKKRLHVEPLKALRREKVRICRTVWRELRDQSNYQNPASVFWGDNKPAGTDAHHSGIFIYYCAHAVHLFMR